MKTVWPWRPQNPPNVYGDVHAFHKRFSLPHPRWPQWPDQKTIEHRLKMIREEADELIEAIGSPERSLIKVAREAIDLAYVALGVFVDFGLPFLPCWKAVQDANMNKLVHPCGGKPLKPDTWKSPNEDVEQAIQRALATKQHR